MNTSEQHRLIGQVIADRYRVEGLLGEGGMGAVYVAEHLTLHKQVALKVVHPEHAGNAEMAARFAQEAMVTSRIDHPNVISAMDYGTLEDGTAFLAVQLVRGPSLSKVLETEGRLHWTRATELASQIADALSAAHAHGIVHRDLKPDNVLLQALDDGGELVKILDFGVAKVARESRLPEQGRSDRHITQLGLIIGTPGYMAPEQAVGSAADHRSDLYALGVILWECITGQALWAGDDLQALVEKQLAQTAPLLVELIDDPAMPEALTLLVAKLLARRADDRPNDATQVRDQLREILTLDDPDKPRWRSGSRRLAARTPSALRRVDVPVAPVPAALAAPIKSLPAARPSRLPGRSSRPAWLLTLLVSTILAGAVFLVATGQLQVRPQGSAAQVAESVAKQLNLPPPVVAAMRADESERNKDGLARTLEPAFDQLVNAEARELRVSAANTLLNYTPMEHVPSYVRRMAYLQLATTCSAKKAELEEMATLRDPRVLPMLLELSQRPRGGCGKRKREDCLACLRPLLSKLIGDLKKP